MIDWERVNTLRDEVGTDDFDEVVDLFMEEVEDVIARLTTSPDQNTFEEDLHFLKGSALSLGFSGFSSLCQTGETLSAQGNVEEVDLPSILASYASSKQLFLVEVKQALAS